jgi:hypothetical protein
VSGSRPLGSIPGAGWVGKPTDEVPAASGGKRAARRWGGGWKLNHRRIFGECEWLIKPWKSMQKSFFDNFYKKKGLDFVWIKWRIFSTIYVKRNEFQRNEFLTIFVKGTIFKGTNFWQFFKRNEFKRNEFLTIFVKGTNFKRKEFLILMK